MEEMLMRVRSNRNPSESRPRVGLLRRPHAEASTAAPAPPAPAPAAEPHHGDDLADERRMRESGGPDDRAMYTCSCGYVFEADVSTSVTCPHCGTGQAW
jgi:rubrerythrin